MGWLQAVMLLYGIFDIAMGLIGYLNKGSIVSLIAGATVGILVIGCAALTKTNPRVGFIGATVLALLMAGNFAGKTFSGIVYPAGIIFAVSIIFAVTLVGAHFAAVNKRKNTTSIDPKA
jgi:uncharacterized membrane protein (UPF0136 family)